MSKKCHRDAAIVWITGITRLLVVHRRVHNLEQLTEEILLWVRARCINHYAIQVVKLGIAQACFCKWRVGLKCLSSIRLGSFPSRFSLGSGVADLNI